jgi:ABC-2 type transport system permease protein
MGYYGLTFSFIMIPIAIQASYLGFHILSVEERELTADFLLTKPIPRLDILIYKMYAVFASLAITMIAVMISSYVSLLLFNSGDTVNYGNATILLLTIPLFQLFFVSIGTMISVMVKKVSSVIAYSMGLGFGLFIISSFGEMLSSNLFKSLSPFSYFEPVSILVNGHWNLVYTLVTILIIIISFGLTYFFYQRRNIASL